MHCLEKSKYLIYQWCQKFKTQNQMGAYERSRNIGISRSAQNRNIMSSMCCLHINVLFKILFLIYFFISWRLITILQWFLSYTDMNQPWIYMYFPSWSPPLTFLSTRSLWVFPVHQVWPLVSCIQPGLVVCFTLDNIHVSMLFSRNIPPSPSPTESKSLFYTSVSLFLFCV